MDKVKITMLRDEVGGLVRFLTLNAQRHASSELELRGRTAHNSERFHHGLRREALQALHDRMWIAAPRFRFKEVSLSIPKAEAFALLAEWTDTKAIHVDCSALPRVCGQLDQALA